MIDEVRRRLERAMNTGLGGTSVSAEELLVAALVAAPFAGTFGIWLAALTWWPNPAIWAVTTLAQAAGTLWVAGHRRAEGSEE